MNRTVYYNPLIWLLTAAFVAPIQAKLLKPSNNGQEKDILIISQKRRLYYHVDSNGLRYDVLGPMRMEFISRYPVIKKKRKSHPFNYLIVLDGKDTVKVSHRYKIQKSIKSVQHPKHKYTYSGNYFINLDKGQHSVEILEGESQKYPVLIRVVSKEFESIDKDRKILTPMVHQNSVTLLSNNKEVKYYECTSELPLQVEGKGIKTLRIMSRLEFSSIMGQEESYRIRVREANKVVGTYYFNTERSSASQIIGKDEKVPGKWRSCEVPVPKGKHTYTIELADKDKAILTRFILY